MTSKEMEARSGVPRANIRYYEAEGLLAPARSGNGYRDYSEEDLRTLEKIKLLRRLGVTIEELRALRDGKADLGAVLDRRLAEVGGEQAALGRVERVCGDLRRSGATFAGLDPGKYLADLDAPALPGEGGPWWDKASAPALPETDRLPTVHSAFRRFFARTFDEFLMRMLLASGLCLAGGKLTTVNNFVVSLAAVVLLAFLEPLFLRLWGTTPGKALLGMRLTGPDGKNMPYTEGLARYFLMMWYGQGFEIPIWSAIQWYRSARRCWDDEPQPWDVEVAYIAKPFRARYGVGLVLASLLVLTAGEAANSWSQTPPNRGDVTVAEFAENFNWEIEYLELSERSYLTPEGQWRNRPEVDENGSYAGLSLDELMGMEDWPEAREFHYTVEDGHVTAVTLSGTVDNAVTGRGSPEGYVPLIVMALTFGREESAFWYWPRQAQMRELEEADWERGFTLHQPGVVITAEVEQTGFYYYAGIGWQPMEEENHLSFTYTVALDN
ncbi:MerR family transcriptional regulator [uncultured Oscillibacter sp.]|uniref:MerR family transcriptional regulator n=1 Tax=uncultured Oscillibacter sp. TaxID=876091 RepID=UPI001F870B62|nr:MerR family transcriptional regulator [uncultured Oscillibacter sp.]HJB75885.1 MerR family transcriptional regulator [Candidatus Oscillibacter avistercoris]